MQYHGRGRGRILRTRILYRGQRLRILAQFQVGPGAYQGHFIAHARRQVVHLQCLQHFLLPTDRQQQIAQRHDVFGPRHPLLLRLAQRHLGGRVVALAQRRTAEKHVRGEEVRIRLERVLELDDGAGVVLLFEADQRVLVVAAGGIGGLHRRVGEQPDREQGRSEGGTMEHHGRPSDCRGARV